MIAKNQEWINLSNKNFENTNYANNGKSTIYFKIANGLWFSLPTDDKYVSEWGNFIKDCNELRDKVIDDEGKTNITCVKLKDTSYIVELHKWKQTILEVLQSTPFELSSDEKRKILLSRINQETGNENIEHLIFDIKEFEFSDIQEMYYNQSGEQIKKQKDAHEFAMIDEVFNMYIDPHPISDFENYKKNTLLKIELLKKIQEGNTYEELEKYFSADEKNELNFKIKIYKSRINILQDIIMSNKKHFEHLTPEMLDKYKHFIDSIENLEEYIKLYQEYTVSKLDMNKEITWLADYFSGCMNREYITGYDMPSLTIFDTDSIDVLSQKKAIIFNEKEYQPIDGFTPDDIEICTDAVGINDFNKATVNIKNSAIEKLTDINKHQDVDI